MYASSCDATLITEVIVEVNQLIIDSTPGKSHMTAASKCVPRRNVYNTVVYELFKPM